MKTRIALLIACAAVCSCATLGKYKPVSEVSASLYGDALAAEDTAGLASVGWKSFFTDPLLRNYIAASIEGNKDLQIAAERVKSSRAAVTGAKMGFFPSLALNPAYNGEKAAGNYAGNLSVAGTASWQLGIFRSINNLKSANADAALMEDYRQAVLSELVANVANLYYTLLMLDSQKQTAEKMVANWERFVEMSKDLKESGLADQVAVLQYEASLEKYRIAVMELSREIKVCENSMCVLMGVEVGRTIERGELASQNVPENLSTGLPVKLLTLRPDVRSAQRELELAHYARRGALLNFFPALSITGAYGLVDPFSGSVSSMNVLANVAASLVAPVFSSGINRTAYEKAKIAQTQTRLNFDKTLLDAGKEVNDAMSEFKSRSEMAKSYEIQVKALDKAREDTEYLMKNSLDKTYLDVLYANTTFFEAELSLIENMARRLQSSVTLYAALGGGVIE